MAAPAATRGRAEYHGGMIELLGFDGDDTLWHSEAYYQRAHGEFEAIVGAYVDLADAHVHERLLATERRNLGLFGYGAKGMTLSMLETAIALTDGRIAALDLHRLIELGKAILAHPVDLLDGMEAAVRTVAARHRLVLITKGDLFHQEAKVARCGLADLFGRIEIVSEKDPATYARLLREFDLPAGRFAMVGNSLRSDIAPVVELGGWGVYLPYHVTWAHERDTQFVASHPRVREIARAAELPAAVEALEAQAREAAEVALEGAR
jgi:putative hydrolase of the HAD superfamily